MEKLKKIIEEGNRWVAQTIKIFLMICFVVSCFYGCDVQIGQKEKSTFIGFKCKGLLNK